MNIAEALSLLGAWREHGTITCSPEDQSFFDFCLANAKLSQAQLFQDLWVAYELSTRRGGFFVEFGAANGIKLSNTFFLEKNLGWSGILAEPSRSYYPALLQNRDCFIDRRCVWTETGEQLIFNETVAAELSTIDAFSESDHHAAGRRIGSRYTVETVSLNDLLSDWSAPRRIDYLSIDTEGSELEILTKFDFQKYDVRTITVEHNYTDNRALIHELLSRNGFVRKFEGPSRWDDWYIKSYR